MDLTESLGPVSQETQTGTPPRSGPCVTGGAYVDGVFLDEAELGAREEELAGLSSHIDAATHRQLRLVRIMDVSERWGRQGAKSCAHWLSWRIGVELGTAREQVRVARALEGLSKIDDALRRGALSYSKVRAMTRVATPANEERLLDIAQNTTAAQLEKVCRGVRQQQREDGRAPSDAPERSVRMRFRGDGTVKVEAVLLADEGHRVMDAVRMARDSMDQGLTIKPDHADALVRIAEAVLAGQLAGSDTSNDADANERDAHAVASTSDAGVNERDVRAAAGTSDDADANERDPSDAASTTGAADANERDVRAAASTSDDADANERDPSDAAGTSYADASGLDQRDASGLDQRDAAKTSDGADASGRDQRDAASTSGDVGVNDDVGASDDAGASEREAPGVPAPEATVVGQAGRRRSRGGERTQLVVHFTREMVEGKFAAQLDDGAGVSAETFRRLACDCSLLGVVEDGKGDVLDVGRRSRRVPAALHRAVMLRDQHCQFPGCTHEVHIDLHHVEHWLHGGETSKRNLLALCTFHHRLVHEGGFTVGGDGDSPRFFGPDGQVIPPVRTPPKAPADPHAAFEEAHAPLAIHAETGLTSWDGDPIDYGACVEVVCAADEERPRRASIAAPEPHDGLDETEPTSCDPARVPEADLDLPATVWLAKHYAHG